MSIWKPSVFKHLYPRPLETQLASVGVGSVLSAA